jgi:HNH endonuclease
MKGRWIRYSDDELTFIRDNCQRDRRELLAEFNARFNREVALVNLNALCKRNGWLTGRTGRFNVGLVPANKGKKMPFNENSARTQFKRGNLPHNSKFEGHERLSKQGYVEISIPETNPHTGFERRHVLKHKWLWEKVNGPLPKGMALKCLDGDRKNTAPSNWVAVSRASLPRLSGRWTIPYDTAPAELKPLILATAKLFAATTSAAKGGKV